MVCTNTTTTFNGYTFTYLAAQSDPAQGLFCYSVQSATPMNQNNLSNWVLEVCPDCPDFFREFINIEECTFSPAQTGANCEKRTQVPPNQVPLIGVVFNYNLGRQPNNSATFCVEFDTPMELGEVRVGFKAGNQNPFVSPTTICGPVCSGIKGCP
ncbi:hypothetical protein [Neobacillus sp. YIM B06451]|uniref:hypothetical protein n=1 Tax=Neobacillus sp. YIM B06451 TaxID=3070994 RepID=UPI002931C21C|nr:hypothetical protein [Neobacillus sp. YIM B06451]